VYAHLFSEKVVQSDVEEEPSEADEAAKKGKDKVHHRLDQIDFFSQRSSQFRSIFCAYV
jgi:hypothetical protein